MNKFNIITDPQQKTFPSLFKATENFSPAPIWLISASEEQFSLILPNCNTDPSSYNISV